MKEDNGHYLEGGTMELEELVLKTYSVQIIGEERKAIATLDSKGRYKASCAKDVEDALNTRRAIEAVWIKPQRIKWFLMKRTI